MIKTVKQQTRMNQIKTVIISGKGEVHPYSQTLLKHGSSLQKMQSSAMQCLWLLVMSCAILTYFIFLNSYKTD